jgi:outer membrane biosynthesis protein TonB
MKLYQSILIFVALGSMASAQTAMQLFNPAAKEYIYGNTPVASNLVEQALMKFPDDEKLLKLKKLIEEQKQKQDQQKQDQQKQDQQNKDQNQKDQKQNQDQKKDQKNQDQQNQQDQQQKQNEDQKQDQANQKQKPDQQQNQQPAQPKRAGEMSPEEAQQLLDAMKQDEQDQRANLKPYLGGPVRVNKDW